MAGERNESLIPSLPAVLAWRTDQSELLHRVDDVQATFVRERIESICGPAGKTAAMLDRLPPNWRRRVELAPEIHRLVDTAPERNATDTCRTLARFCAVESAVQGFVEDGSTVPPDVAGCWSALGDYYLGDFRDLGGTGEPANFDLPAPYRRLGELTFAPMARQTIVDGYTPFNALIFRHCPWSVEPPRPTEFQQAVARISSALDFIETVSAQASAMLAACLRVVVVARVPEHPHMDVSGSHPESPGLAGFTNLHSDRWTDEQIADTVLHEAIHNLVAKLELAGGMFTGISGAAHDVDVQAVSPWSGRRIRLHTYVHACFVWHGLARFWERAVAQGAGGVQRAQRARKGFEGGAHLQGIPPDGNAIIRPEVMESLRTLMDDAA